jgi:hypothetical protein
VTTRGIASAFLAAAALAVISSATAKDSGPGDLRVCNAHCCVPIVNRAVLPLLGRFYPRGSTASSATA